MYGTKAGMMQVRAGRRTWRASRLRQHAAPTCSDPRLLCSQFFKDGAALPATVIALEGGNIVTQVKSADKDGYTAVQVRGRQARDVCAKGVQKAGATRACRLRARHATDCCVSALPRLAVQIGYKTCRDDKITKPELGHLKKAGAPAMKHLREFKVRRGLAHSCSASGSRRARARRCLSLTGTTPAARRSKTPAATSPASN